MTNSRSFIAYNYKIANYMIAGIIGCIFLYSALFSPEGGKHPVPSFYTQLTDNDSPSTGLSRSFSAIVRGDFKLANSFNPIGIQIFLFFIIQLGYRIGSVLLLTDSNRYIKSYIIADVLISIFGFCFVFKPLISFTFSLFQKTILEFT